MDNERARQHDEKQVRKKEKTDNTTQPLPLVDSGKVIPVSLPEETEF